MNSRFDGLIPSAARAISFSRSSARYLLAALLLFAAGAALAVPPDLTPIANQSVREGATLDIALSATDPDGGAVTFTATGLPGFCNITDDAGPDGNIQCTPGAGTDGNSNVTVFATDDNVPAEQSQDNFVLTVNANGTPSISNIGNQTVAEGGTLVINFTASDPDGDGLTYSSTTLPGFCSFTDNTGTTGQITCNPGASTAGTTNVTVVVTDNGPLPEQDSDSFNLEVTPNSPPVLTNINNQSMAEGGSLDISLNATDPDGDNVTFTASGLPGFCSITDNTGPGGNINCSPGASTQGTYPITVTATDDGPGNLQSQDSFDLAVSTNTPPDLTPIADQSVAEGGTLDIGLNATDPDAGQTVTFTANGLPGFCSITDNTGPGGNIRCTPGAGTSGDYPITVIATDNGAIPANSQDGFTLTVSANNPPNLTAIADQSMGEGETLDIGLNATDADAGQTVTFSANGLPGFCSITDSTGPNGNIRCTPGGGDEGNYPITVIATDNGTIPASSQDGFTLSVSGNNPPNLTPIPDQSMGEGESLDIALNATDPDAGQTVTFTTSNLPNFCTLTDNTGPGGNINCSPGANTANNYPITVIATDNGTIPASSQDTFILSVGANQPPNLTPIADQSVVEGDALNIPLNAPDPDGDNVTFSTTPLPRFCVLTDNTGPIGAIDCNPAVGDAGSFPITVTATDDGSIPASASDPFTLTVGANQAPTASNVNITGDPSVGSVLQGNYTYADAENDPEGTSTFRWLRDGQPIPGETAQTYMVVVADVETEISFEVTPVATSGALTGTPVTSPGLTISNSAPSITGQQPLETAEDTSLTIVLGEFTVTDADSTFPDDFTLTVRDGANYTRSGIDGNTITPAPDFNGTLTVPVTVNDGFVDSAIFNATVTVTPVNDAPEITGQQPLSTPEDTSLQIAIADLVVVDVDGDPISDLRLQPGPNYALSGSTGVTPVADFNGQLNVPATVADSSGVRSNVFVIAVTVESVNDVPVLVQEIGPQNAVEGSPFTVSIAGNFSDTDVGDQLTYSLSIDPPLPSGAITLNSQTGQFSGAPTEADALVDTPVYNFTVTAQDSTGAQVSDTFPLTISALGRANIALNIDVTPDTALPNDELQWTFTSTNPVGPEAGENVVLRGSFIGSGLTVSTPGANCTITSRANGADFNCTVGSVPVGGEAVVTFTTTANQTTEIAGFATSEGAQPVPIDPNPEDNSDFEATGVGDDFSPGAVQNLGSTSILSVDVGDVNGDGVTDVVVGTAAGQPVQVYLAGPPRETCMCQRDFLPSPLSIPDLGANRGVALADFNNDGTLDLAIANGGGQEDRVYSNDGTGNFTLMETLDLSNANDIAVGDFNFDGNADIAIAASSPNLVWLGNGSGGFSVGGVLGDADSRAVAVGRFDNNNRDDLAFANVGSPSTVWTKNSGLGFSLSDTLDIGDAVAVAAGDLDGDGDSDLVFGRIPSGPGDIPSNPVLLNQLAGNFGNPQQRLGISPTNDVLIGDIDGNGAQDIVVINASGVHQIWDAAGNSWILNSQQIIDPGARRGVLAELGEVAMGEPGGIDLAVGGALNAGSGVYLNDSFGNLGRGDTIAPVVTLIGEPSVETPSNTVYRDPGVTVTDNIDSEGMGITIIEESTVNVAVVGNYTVTYTVSDFAGNEAPPVVRNVTVTPASGTGGGGGGSLSIGALLMLSLFAGALLARRRLARARVPKRHQ